MAIHQVLQRGGRIWAAMFLCCLPAMVPVNVEAQGATAPAVAMDPRVAPGASFALDFPALVKIRSGGVTKMNVQLPGKYDPHKLYPLVAWMDGGDGGSSPGAAAELVDKDKFICVGLPFPAGCNNPGQSNMVGNFPEMWKYHRAMLEELLRVVPNISPQPRILAGFSNGGHTIAGYLPMNDPEVMGWFNTYISIEGSFLGGSYSHLAGRHFCVGWGEGGGSNQGEARLMAERAKSAKMKVMCLPQPGVGHGFSADAKKKVKEWIHGVVIPEMVAQALEGVAGGPDYSAGKALEVLVEGTEKEGPFKAAMARLEETIKKEYEPIKALVGGNLTGPSGRSNVEILRGFVRKYRYSEAANQCEVPLEKIANEELAKLFNSWPADLKGSQRLAAAGTLSKFEKEWEGLAATAAAHKKRNEYSDLAFNELKATLPEKPTVLQRDECIGKLRRFLEEWPATSGTYSAESMLGGMGRAELMEIVSKRPDRMSPEEKKTAIEKLTSSQKKWEGTPVAEAFKRILAYIENVEKH